MLVPSSRIAEAASDRALGELVAAIELERAEAPELLRALETDDVVDPTECLILAGQESFV